MNLGTLFLERLFSRKSGKNSPLDEAGTAVVEFALVGSLFFFLVAIAVQGALIFNAWLVITDVSTEAARFGAPCYGRAIQPCSLSDVTNYVTQNTTGLIQQSNLSVSASTSGGLITVSTSYNVPIICPFVSAFLSNPTTVIANSSMRLENGGS